MFPSRAAGPVRRSRRCAPGVEPDVVPGDLVGLQDFLARAASRRRPASMARMKAPSIAPSITTCATCTPFGPSLARQALRQRAQRVLGAGEGGKPAPPRTLAVAPVNRIVPAPARRHDPRRLAAGEKAGESRHLPDLGIDLRRRLDDREAHIGADVEDQHFDRPDRPLDRCRREPRRRPPRARRGRRRAPRPRPRGCFRRAFPAPRGGAGAA